MDKNSAAYVSDSPTKILIEDRVSSWQGKFLKVKINDKLTGFIPEVDFSVYYLAPTNKNLVLQELCVSDLDPPKNQARPK